MKKGGETGVIRWRIFPFVSLIRYIIWSPVSIPIIWLLATDGLLGPDPILWFALMLMLIVDWAFGFEDYDLG